MPKFEVTMSKTFQQEGRIAAQIKTKRQKINISQQELADLADILKSTIWIFVFLTVYLTGSSS